MITIVPFFKEYSIVALIQLFVVTELFTVDFTQKIVILLLQIVLTLVTRSLYSKYEKRKYFKNKKDEIS